MKLFKILKKYFKHIFSVFLENSIVARNIVRLVENVVKIVHYYNAMFISFVIGIVQFFYLSLVRVGRFFYEIPINVLGGYHAIKRKELNNYFRERIDNFYAKKIPNSEKYPFMVHNPYMVFSEAKGYEKLFFVGDNWLDKECDKPIALLVGFNNWKYGFISDYLKEYKVIFTPLKMHKIYKYLLLRSLNPKPNFIVVWGYNNDTILEKYAKNKNIPLYRMEDGFVRSALLGASHATPYSLILDKKGLYYNPEIESDLEAILNTYNFKDDEILMKNAEEALSLLVKMKISKYNTPSTKKIERLEFKTKKRVVVLGQVDKDNAIKYGNLDNWSSEDLVRLARYENPDADVYYRPHPEIYKGFQKSKFRRKKIEYFAKIVSPDEPLLEFLETIDHVYVINSLSGLEALVRGIKVTVVGAAFYGGWGLTDDRYKFERRKRTLTLLELFAGIYLKYPKYLASDDGYTGLKAACYRIKSDFILENYSLHKLHTQENNVDLMLSSAYWPYFLMHHKENLSIKEEKTMIASSQFKKYFEGNDSVLFQTTLLYFIAGKLSHNESRDYFIRTIRVYIDSLVLNQFLLDMLKYYPGDYILKHFSWLFKDNKEYESANEVMNTHLQSLSKVTLNKRRQAQRSLCYAESNDDVFGVHGNILTLCENDEDEIFESPLENIDIDSLRESLENSKLTLDYLKFIDVAKTLLVSDNANTVLFTRLTEMAMLKTDYKSAVHLASFLRQINIYAHNNVPLHMELESFDFSQTEESFAYITQLFALQLTLNPDRINRSWARLKHYFIENKHYELFTSIVHLYSGNDIHKAVAYLELNKAEKALYVLEKMVREGYKSDKLSVEYAKTLFTLNNHKKAEEVIKKAMEIESTHANYTEYLRQLKARGKFKKALAIAKEGLSKKIPLTDEGHIMPIYFGLGQIEDGFKCFHESVLQEKLILAFGKDKYRKSHDLDQIEKLLLIFSAGPAEEMRFSSMYEELAKKIGYDNFKITCDYRLKNILTRSFPKINFIAVKRTRFFTPEYPSIEYDRLPSSELCIALDNKSMEHIDSAKEIKLVSELFFHFRKKYSDFVNKKPHLVVDTKRTSYFKERLPKGTVLVGLSWRSTLTNAMRNIHYLTVDDMAPLFKIPNITFVNLQYDHCQHDLDEIKKKYNVELIDFPELDQMNDFDGVAGLMKNLDLVIAPFTAVAELAGSIGVNGILFSNHGESHWRQRADNVDVWYESIKVIGDGEIGDKKSLVSSIEKELLQLSKIK
jgi:capsular polysaccharide export protein